MSIIPVSSLSVWELACLGNNLIPAARRHRRQIKAVNRSLATVGEQVSRLYRPRLNTGKPFRALLAG